MRQTREERESEKRAEVLTLKLRAHTRQLAKTIPRIPAEGALFHAQRLATTIAMMMFDLACEKPEDFFRVWPFIERDIHEAQAAVSLLRFRLAQPMVRAVIDKHLQN